MEANNQQQQTGTGSILIVDDSPVMQMHLKSMLCKMDYEVHVAALGREACILAKEVRPHLDPRLEDSLTGWLWKTCVWPGVRCDFRGDPVVLGPLEPDQSWVDPIVGLDDGQLGAIEDQLVA